MPLKPHKKPDNRLAAGVDRGGTSIRIVLINGRGSVIRQAAHPTTTIKRLPALLIKTAADWKLAPHVPFVIATRGAMTKKWKKPFLLEKLKGRLNLLDVIPDAQAAYLAAHGSGDGVLLIAGTGSVAFLKRRNGRFEKIGGYRPVGGDPGSGLWIGARFLKTAKMGKKDPVCRNKASYAAIAIREAKNGDPEAAELIREAHERLADILAGAVKKQQARTALRPASRLKKRVAGTTEPIRVALAGGLMNNAFFRNTFISRARGRLDPVRLTFVTLKRTAEYAAARLAMDGFYGRNKGS